MIIIVLNFFLFFFLLFALHSIISLCIFLFVLLLISFGVFGWHDEFARSRPQNGSMISFVRARHQEWDQCP